MRLCLIGGTPSHPGGLEAFCDRARAALASATPPTDVDLIATNTAYRGARALLDLPVALVRLRRLARTHDVAWVQVSNLPDAFYVALARIAGMRVLATPHFGANSAVQQKVLRRGLVRWLVGRADGILLLFRGQGEEITLPNLPTTVLGTFLPQSALRDGEADETVQRRPRHLRLLHAARFSAEKGTFHMLALCARLRAAHIPFEARLVGRSDPATMDSIAEAIRQAGLEDVVEQIDWLDEAEMQQQLRSADVLVHLSAIDSFPLIVLEALAADCLPVVLPMAGARDMVEAMGGLLADPADPAGSAFDRLAELTPDQVRAKGRAAGAKTRREYGWPVMVQRVLTSCQQALDRV